MNNQNQKLQAQIIQLKQDKEQMRLFLHELIEAFYKSVNKDDQNQETNSSTWTFDPNLEQLFKGFSQIIKSCPNCSNKTNSKFPNFGSTNLKECNWEQMQDIFAKMKGEKHE